MARIQPRGWRLQQRWSRAIYRSRRGASPAPAGPRPPPVDLTPWARRTPGPGTLTHIPLPAAHTLSRLCAWVRGDSSCSTRRSWGAARESITATPPDPAGAFGPQTGSGRHGPDVLGGDSNAVVPRSPALGPVSGTQGPRPGNQTWPTRGAADPGGRASHPPASADPPRDARRRHRRPRSAREPEAGLRGVAPPAVAGKRSPGNWAAGGATDSCCGGQRGTRRGQGTPRPDSRPRSRRRDSGVKARGGEEGEVGSHRRAVGGGKEGDCGRCGPPPRAAL